MTLPIDTTDRPPSNHATVVVGAGGDVEPAAALDVRPFGPAANSGAIYARWMGSGAAVLWYLPLTPRQAYTESETTAGVPKEVADIGDFIPLDFASQYEGQFLQASHIHGDSTAGTWILGY